MKPVSDYLRSTLKTRWRCGVSYLSGARRSFTVRGATTFRLTVRFTSSALGPLVRLAVPSRASHTQCARGTSPYFLALVVWWGLQYLSAKNQTFYGGD